ncbi:MAG: hypothetical protein IKW14_05000 [Phascolarctobacterium sp.]|nr:hypothetical protein [Phascolarctobacterium sp.]
MNLDKQYIEAARNAADFTEEYIYSPLLKILRERDDVLTCEMALKYCNEVALPKIAEMKRILTDFSNKAELNSITEQVLYATFMLNTAESNTMQYIEYFTTAGQVKELARYDFWESVKHLKELMFEYKNSNSLVRTGTSTYELTPNTIESIKVGMTYLEVIETFKMPPTRTLVGSYVWSNGKRGAKALKVEINFKDDIVTNITK